MKTSARRRRLGLLALACAALAWPASAGAAPLEAGPQAPSAGKGLWQALSASAARGALRGASVRPERYRLFELARGPLADALADAPLERRGGRALVLSLPGPGGGFQRFAVEESPVLAPELARRHPEIRTYAGTGIDDPAATIRADLTPLGFHASVRSPAGSWYVDPTHRLGEGDVYVSYRGADLENPRGPLVEHEEIPEGEHDEEAHGEDASREGGGPLVSLRTYRLALVSDPSYADFFNPDGDAPENVTAAKATLVNRLNQVYETESAIRFVLANGNDALNLDTEAEASGTNGPCGAAACYPNTQLASCTGTLISRTRIVVGQLLGASNYDVGHIVLGKNGGGIAGLGVVGLGGKARGCTGLPEPVGDFFAVDYVAHELGHQFNAHHTFNGTNGNCSGSNRSQPDSVEPGSGSSIMAYAGICGADDLQPHTDPYWSQHSRDVIAAFVSSARSPISEVQTVSLTGFGNTDSFRLRFGGNDSAPIVRGTNYTTAGIRTAIRGIAGFPGTGDVTVAGFGGGAFDDTGFQVTFGGSLGATDVGLLGVVDTSGVTGFAGETDKGGAVTNGGVVTPTANSAPDVTAPAGFTIPTRTPFALTASGSDPDGDPITYLWEQDDSGVGSGIALGSNAKTSGPLFRVFGTPLLEPPYVQTQYNSPGVNVPTADPTRVFPDLAQILAGNTNAATGACPAANVECFSEFLPTADYLGTGGLRQLRFRVTVRDGRAGGGGVGTADTVLTVAPAAGPFLVTAPNDATPRVGGSELTVTWDVAGTSGAPVGAENVRISLSVDGGLTYPHELAASTANDGSHAVTLPEVEAEAARIKVEAVGNVFFDLSDASFPIVEDNGLETVIESGPSGLVNDATPTFTFRSEPAGATTFECRVDTAPFAACSTPYTTDPLAEGPHVFEVRVKDGDDVDLTPATRSFTVDTVPPVTTIQSGPAGPTNDPAPTFAFSSEPGATFECEVDEAAFEPCSSPHTTEQLADGAHTFRVRATDAAGNVEAPVTRAFTVDTVPPESTIDSGPTGLVSDASPTFTFSSEPGATFECRVDGGEGDFAACTSPHETAVLAQGPRVFHVRARDAAGNVETAPPSRSFTVDTIPPTVTILSGPTGVTTNPTPSFAFSSEAGATLECRVDAAAFAACTSPYATATLAPGAHTFQVRGSDEAGNVSAPASRSFTYALPLQTTLGKRTIKQAARTATFRFTGSGGVGKRTFQCRLTGAKTTKGQRAWSKCASPRTYRKLKPGLYTFHVRARDAAGRVDTTPAKSAFRIRR